MVLLHPLALHGEVLLHLCPSIAGVLLHLVHAVLYTMGVFVSISANGVAVLILCIEISKGARKLLRTSYSNPHVALLRRALRPLRIAYSLCQSCVVVFRYWRCEWSGACWSFVCRWTQAPSGMVSTDDMAMNNHGAATPVCELGDHGAATPSGEFSNHGAATPSGVIEGAVTPSPLARVLLHLVLAS